MQNLTLTLKGRPNLRVGWVATTLFALVLTLLGYSAAAQQQGSSTASIRSVIVTSGTSSSSAVTKDYNGTQSTPGPDNFSQQDFGTFDVNAGRLLLQGGTVEITETNGEVYTRAYIGYGVTAGTFASANPNLLQTIELTQTGYDASTGIRTFMVSNAARDILALATVGGADNGSNRFDVTVNATGSVPSASGGFDDVAISGSNVRRKSVFTATGTPSTATISPANIQIAADGAANPTPYYFPNTGTSPQFPGYNFTSSQNAGGVNGAFDINNGQLRLLNTSVTTTEAGSNKISDVVLYYRTRAAGTGGAAFQAITLTQSGSVVNGTRTFIIDPTSTSNTNAQPNLVATPAVTTVGNYVVEVYYQASGVNSLSGNPFTITYPPTNFSSATFTVAGTPIAFTIWTGANNDNWFDQENWSAGVPTKTTNALVRDLGAGNKVPYPNIYSNAVRRTDDNSAVLYDNTNSGPAQTLNLILGGSSQASRSIARLVSGQLQVFGNFSNNFDSFVQRENTIMEFAGSDQAVSGGSFSRVDISGGGKKTMNGIMFISQSLNFLTPDIYTKALNPVYTNPYTATSTDAGILATDIRRPVDNQISFADRSNLNGNNGAQLNGETDIAYLYGFARTTRQSVATGENQGYGNLGLDIAFTGANNPGNVEVTRNTVEAYAPGPTRFGVRRIFGVRPSDQATNSGGLIATLVFHYRNSETVNLDGPDTITPGSESIPEQDLTIFVSSNSGNTFQLVGRDGPVDQVNNTVTRTGVTTFATFTLGDINHPLPVVLTAFNAARSGANASLTWKTATETNSKGFEVQVSTDGTAFRTLGFVSSQSPNSLQARNYKYTDTESGKFGTRYYRLHQVDLDGKDSYSPTRAVSFDGAATGAVALSVYPNPFLDTDKVSLNFGSDVANGLAQVQLIDMVGRTVRQQSLTINNASLDLGDLSDLHSGMYLVRITLADGSTQSVRLQKK